MLIKDVTIDSDPSGYDRKYSGSFYKNNPKKLEIDYKKVKENISGKIAIDISQKFDKSKPDTEALNIEDEISNAKIYLLVRTVAKRIKQYEAEDFENVQYINILEYTFSEKENLSISDRFSLLKIITSKKQTSFSPQEKTVIFKEISKASKYSYDEKISALNIILDEKIINDLRCIRHIINKITLLTIVKNSGFVMDFSEISDKEKRKEIYRESIDPDSENPETNNDETQIKTKSESTEKINATSSVKELVESPDKNVKKLDVLSDILLDSEISTEDKLYAMSNVVLNDKLPLKKTFTQMLVNSKEYFKYGAGVTAFCDGINYSLPSGYIIDDKLSDEIKIIYSSDIKEAESMDYLFKSPLVVFVEKKKAKVNFDLHDFFNENMNECNKNNLKYRQTVVGRFPSVIRHKKDSNIYIVAVFNYKKASVFEFRFQFNIPIVNKESTVSRMLSGIKFGRRVKFAI